VSTFLSAKNRGEEERRREREITNVEPDMFVPFLHQQLQQFFKERDRLDGLGFGSDVSAKKKKLI